MHRFKTRTKTMALSPDNHRRGSPEQIQGRNCSNELDYTKSNEHMGQRRLSLALNLGRIVPRIIKGDKQALYQQNLQLKHEIKMLRQQIFQLKTRINIEINQKAKMADQIVQIQSPDKSINSKLLRSARIATVSLQNENYFKNIIRQSTSQLSFLLNENKMLKKTLKYTKIDELKIENKQLIEETRRLSDLLSGVQPASRRDTQQLEKKIQQLSRELKQEKFNVKSLLKQLKSKDEQIQNLKKDTEDLDLSERRSLFHIRKASRIHRYSTSTQSITEKSRIDLLGLCANCKVLRQTVQNLSNKIQQIQRVESENIHNVNQLKTKSPEVRSSDEQSIVKIQVTQQLRRQLNTQQKCAEGKTQAVKESQNLQNSNKKSGEQSTSLRQKIHQSKYQSIFDAVSQRQEEASSKVVTQRKTIERDKTIERHRTIHKQQNIQQACAQIDDESDEEYPELKDIEVNEELTIKKQMQASNLGESRENQRKRTITIKNQQRGDFQEEINLLQKSKKSRQYEEVLRQTITYRLKSQKYTYEDLVKDIKDSELKVFSMDQLATMLCDEPFYLSSSQLEYILTFIFGQSVIQKSEKVPYEQFLSKINPFIAPFKVEDESSLQDTIVHCRSLIKDNSKKLMLQFRQNSNEDGLLTKSSFVRSVSLFGFGPQQIQFLIGEATLVSETTQEINYANFLKRICR